MNYKINVKKANGEQIDADMIQEQIEAEDEKEAIEFAKEYIKERMMANYDGESDYDIYMSSIEAEINDYSFYIYNEGENVLFE